MVLASKVGGKMMPVESHWPVCVKNAKKNASKDSDQKFLQTLTMTQMSQLKKIDAQIYSIDK